MIDAKLLSEKNGKLTMANNGTGTEPCIVALLNPFREEIIYLDELWTDSGVLPIEFYDQGGLALSFTKFDRIEKFFLQDIFYTILVPVGASFTAVGHDSKIE